MYSLLRSHSQLSSVGARFKTAYKPNALAAKIVIARMLKLDTAQEYLSKSAEIKWEKNNSKVLLFFKLDSCPNVIGFGSLSSCTHLCLGNGGSIR